MIPTIFKMGGFKSYAIVLRFANYLAKIITGARLSFAANAALVHILKVVNPILLFVTTAWTIIDIAGPAFRVTCTAVMTVLMLRQKYNAIQDSGLTNEDFDSKVSEFLNNLK